MKSSVPAQQDASSCCSEQPLCSCLDCCYPVSSLFFRIKPNIFLKFGTVVSVRNTTNPSSIKCHANSKHTLDVLVNLSHYIYHSHAAYDGAEKENHVMVNILAPLQQDVEKFDKTKGSQKESQHLEGTSRFWNEHVSLCRWKDQ